VERSALITGVTGQDGTYLAELLRRKGYRVVGVSRRAPAPGQAIDQVDYRTGDVSAPGVTAALLDAVRPDEIYHLAGESSPARMWEDPGAAPASVAALSFLLDAVRRHPTARVLLASSSEIFGLPDHAPQNESTRLEPLSPYGAAKAFALSMARAWRRRDGLGVSCAILYNHESPRRPATFVTRKITRGVADIVAGRATTLSLGALDARRDWGFAGDYVDAMWRMVQGDTPADDFVIGTGLSHSVREFCEAAFGAAGLDYRDHVVVDPALLRPIDARTLVADPSKAREHLGWSATTGFDAMVEAMVAADLER
jgi:GDPmannose 4,6-dehydratase